MHVPVPVPLATMLPALSPAQGKISETLRKKNMEN